MSLFGKTLLPYKYRMTFCVKKIVFISLIACCVIFMVLIGVAFCHTQFNSPIVIGEKAYNDVRFSAGAMVTDGSC